MTLTINKRSLPPDHPNLMESLENYVVLLNHLGRGEGASEFQAQAEAIRQRR
jgi:hypothetical protein